MSDMSSTPVEQWTDKDLRQWWLSEHGSFGTGTFNSFVARKVAAELTRLRTELAEVRAERDEAQSSAAMRLTAYECAAHDRKTLAAERNTLRQQLAVARDGLGTIAFEAGHALTDFKRNALLRIEEIAREYLAKLAAGKAGEEGKQS